MEQYIIRSAVENVGKVMSAYNNNDDDDDEDYHYALCIK